MSDDKERKDLVKRREDKLDLDVFKSGKGEYRAVRKKQVKGLAFQNDEEVSEYLKDNVVPLGADAVRVYIPKRFHDVLKAGSDPASVWKSLQKFVIEHASEVLIEQVVKDLQALALRGEADNAVYELERLANPYGECLGVYRAVNEMLKNEAQDEDYGIHVKKLAEIEREIDRMRAIRERLYRDQEDADEMEKLRKKGKEYDELVDEYNELDSQNDALIDEVKRLKNTVNSLETDLDRSKSVVARYKEFYGDVMGAPYGLLFGRKYYQYFKRLSREYCLLE